MNSTKIKRTGTLIHKHRSQRLNTRTTSFAISHKFGIQRLCNVLSHCTQETLRNLLINRFLDSYMKRTSWRTVHIHSIFKFWETDGYRKTWLVCFIYSQARCVCVCVCVSVRDFETSSNVFRSQMTLLEDLARVFWAIRDLTRLDQVSFEFFDFLKFW